MDDGTKRSVDRRLARLEGQVRGLRRMVSEGVYCVDVLTQVAAVRSALDQVAAEIATGHVRSCIAGQGSGSEHPECSGMSQEELLDELRVVLGRLVG